MRIVSANITGSLILNNVDVTDSLVSSSINSGSVSSKLDSLQSSTSSLNSFTSSYSTGSFTGSFKGDGTNLYNIPATGVTGLQLDKIASGAVTASVSANGFNVNSNVSITGSIVASGTSLVSGSSQINITGTTEYSTFSSSISTSIDSLSSSVASTTNTLSSSVSSSIGSLSSSVATTTVGTKNRVDSIEAKTGSYATTGSNTFIGTENITGNLTVTGSVIISSGSAVYNSSLNLTDTSSLTLNSGSNLYVYDSGIISGTFKGSVTGSLGINGNVSITGSIVASGTSLVSGSSQIDITSTTNYTTFSSSVSSSIGNLSSSVATTTLNLSSSVSSSIGSLSSSVATTTSDLSSSIGSLSSSVATNTSGLAGRITTIEGNYATTGSNIFVGNQVITGSICSAGNIVTTGQIVAQTINVQQVTSSIVYSCGSNIFGTDINNTQQFTGSILATGSLTIVGPLSATTIYGSTTICSPVGKFTSCIDVGSGTFSCSVTSVGLSSTGTISLIPSAFTVGSSTAIDANSLTIQSANSNYLLRFKNAASVSLGGFYYDGTNFIADGPSWKFNNAAIFSSTVGINGVTSPAAELQVGKSSDVTIAMSNSSSVTSGNRGSLAWYNSSVSTVANIRAVAVTDNVGTELQFYTRPVAGNLTQVLTLASTGAATFSSTVTAGQGTFAVSSGDNLILEKPTGAYLSFKNGSTLRGSINGNNGTDGINLNYGASHTTALASTGGATFSNIETTLNFNPQTNLLASYYYLNFGGGSIMYRNTTDIYFGSNSKYNSAGSVAAIYTSANGMGLLTMDGGNLRFQATDTSVTAGTVYGVPIRFAINGDGNIGIGTTSPSGLSSSKTLNIYGGAGIAGQLVLDGNSGGNFLSMNAGTSSGDLPIILFNRGFRLGHATAKDATGYRTNYMVNCLGYSKMSPDGTFVNGNNTQYHSMDSINDVVLYAYNRSATGNGILSNVQSCNTSYWSFRGFSDSYGDMAFIYSNGTFGSRTGTYGGIVSDARCKTEICDASSQWSDIKNLRVRNFKLIEDVENDPINAMRQIGFIAQEVETVSPGLVFESGNGCVDSGCWKNVKTSIIHTKAVKALQEAMCRIEILESCLGIM